ncbi:cell separation during budding [Chytridiales sp. JEL 0842]|nr:cell separation during budding [Chytridiales sp. JEL 0842]
MSNAVHKLLTSTKCLDIIQQPSTAHHPTPAHPICLDTELTVQEGCQALAANKISSAPVYSFEEGGFIGMLDYRDLVAYVLEVFHKVPKDPNNFEATMEITDIVKRATLDRQGVPVKLLANLSNRNPLVHVYADAPLLDAIEEFVRSKVHRVVVLERAIDEDSGAEKSKFVGVLSQSTVATMIAKKFGRLSNIKTPGEIWEAGEKSLQELGLVRGDVISIETTDTVLEALYIMHSHSVSSVAIVDRSSGSPRLCGSVSMTDIKEVLGSGRGGWRRLYEPAFKFFATLRNAQGLEAGGSDRIPSFTVHPSTPLIVALEKMAATRAHRIWIVGETADSREAVVGVVSLSDVMPLLLPN